MTTLEKPQQAPAPPTSVVSGGDAPRSVAIRANLLPAEVVSARSALATRKKVLAGLVVVVLLLIGGYALSWWQTDSARSTLSDLQAQADTVQQQQQAYSPLVAVIADAAATQAQLRTLMADDLSWTALINGVRAAAPAGVQFTSFAGTVGQGSGTTTATPALVTPGTTVVGTLAIQGSAPDKPSVAAFLEKLGHVKGLAVPLLTSVTAGPHGLTFSATATITSDALGGRFTRGGK